MLDNYFKLKSTPLVVVDARVMVHKLMGYWPSTTEQTLEWATAQWACLLNDPLAFLPHLAGKPCRVVVVDDNKDSLGQYWRAKLYSAYKANRTTEADRPSAYREIHQALLEYIKVRSNFLLLSMPAFEADDWAAAIARLKYAKQIGCEQVLLYTLDSDWCSLVSDKHNVVWLNSLNNKPRVRSEYEVLRQFNSRSIVVTRCDQIGWVKARYGDGADNVSPGAPVGIMCLHKPQVWPNFMQKQLDWLAKSAPNTYSQDAKSSAAWLTSKGYTIASQY